MAFSRLISLAVIASITATACAETPTPRPVSTQGRIEAATESPQAYATVAPVAVESTFTPSAPPVPVITPDPTPTGPSAAEKKWYSSAAAAVTSINKKYRSLVGNGAEVVYDPQGVDESVIAYAKQIDKLVSSAPATTWAAERATALGDLSNCYHNVAAYIYDDWARIVSLYEQRRDARTALAVASTTLPGENANQHAVRYDQAAANLEQIEIYVAVYAKTFLDAYGASSTCFASANRAWTKVKP